MYGGWRIRCVLGKSEVWDWDGMEADGVSALGVGIGNKAIIGSKLGNTWQEANQPRSLGGEPV